MLTVVMPYWRRQEAIQRSFKVYESFYKDVEYVVVDDGSGDELDIPARIIRLPVKNNALNPCVPFNIGVKEAGEIIVLTNPEIVHREPILDEMRRELEKTGPKGYIMAACWSVEYKRWYCHSSVNGLKTKVPGADIQPPGAGFHFCTMMYKAFFNEIGGFDERYRDGGGYDDNDFLWTLFYNGADFVMRDNLIVDHYRTKTEWPPGGHEKNRKRFFNKWKSRLSSWECLDQVPQ